MNKCPRKHNAWMIHRALELLNQSKPESAGSFKLVWYVQFSGRDYVLKRTHARRKGERLAEVVLDGGPVSESFVNRRHNCDLALELIDQCSGTYTDQQICKYVAWDVVKGTLWALQPMIEDDGYADDSDCPDIADVFPGANSGRNKRGKIVAYDWGFGNWDDDPDVEGHIFRHRIGKRYIYRKGY